MNDVSQQEPDNELPVAALDIKQEPLDIAPDDFVEANIISMPSPSSATKKSLRLKRLRVEFVDVGNVDGNPLKSNRKRKQTPKRSFKKSKDVDENMVCSVEKRMRSKKVNKEPKRKARKTKDVAKAMPTASLSDSEKESTSVPEVVDASGFIVRIEKTISNNGSVMYTCSRCKNIFRNLEAAKAHITNVHLSIKRYTCSDCGRGFDRALDLDEHTKVHTRERPFKCPAENCIYSASWSGTLYKHVRRRHKDYQGDLTLATIAKGKRGQSKVGDNILSTTEVTGSIGSIDELNTTKPANEDASLLQIPPVEDVENDGGQLDLYEEFNIVDNRNDIIPHYTCKICSENFENLYTIKRHVNEAHKDVRKRTCLICGITLSYSCNLNTHLRIHSGERPHKCAECGKGFNTNSDLKRHARRLQHVSGFKKIEHKCIICKQNLDTLEELEQHASIHVSQASDLIESLKLTPYENAKLTVSESNGSHNYTCNICGMQFSFIPAAKNHVNDDHSDVKTNTCLYCGTTSISRSGLKQHMLIHENKTFNCFNSNCTYVTDQYANLQQHFRDCASISNRATVRKCTICNVEFGDLSILRTHFRVAHKLARSYSCLHCEYSFATLNDLTEHNQSHGANQSVVRCPIEYCQFIVTSEEDRRKHQQRHEKKSNPLPRPFVCVVCGKDFDRNASLSRHMRVVHSH